MAYKAVFNDSLYICHGRLRGRANNQNHWGKGPNGGQFKPGDGDHDGVVDDHAHRRKGDSHYQYREYQNNKYYRTSGKNTNRPKKVTQTQWVVGRDTNQTEGPHLTEAGMKRWEREQQRDAQKPKDKRAKSKQDLVDPERWEREDLENKLAVARGLKSGSEGASKLVGKIFKDPPRERWDLSNMSDQELRNAINRERLEREYNDIFNPQLENEGRKYYQDRIETFSQAAGTAISVMEVIKAVKELKALS